MFYNSGSWEKSLNNSGYVSCVLSTRHDEVWWVEIQPHVCLLSAVGGGTLYLGCFFHKAHWLGGWVDPRAALGRRKICCFWVRSKSREIKKNLIYGNGCDEISKKIKAGKNKKWTDKGNNGGAREAGHHRHYREEKTAVVWTRQKDARGQTTRTNYGMDTTGEKEKRTSEKNVDGRSTSSHDIQRPRTGAMENREEWRLGSGRRRQLLNKPDR